MKTKKIKIMTQEEKDLVLKDICARLPHGVFMGNKEWNRKPYQLTCDEVQYMMMSDDYEDVPYLHPMSNMTEEEKREFYDCVTFEHTDGFAIDECCGSNQMLEKFDWLNAHHFDYRGLIPKGLALSTDKFNPYKD